MSQTNTISPELEMASALRSGKDVFITGGARSGKTFICRHALQILEEEGLHVVLTAPTDIAADAIGGITLHRLLGLSGPLILHDETGNASLQQAAKTSCQKQTLSL
ncbi:MAG: AAA family ATPase [Clostridia bacterium]|nr:AAA family ATPase [Clostridia bacterium]